MAKKKPSSRRPIGRPRIFDDKKRANACRWAKRGNSLNAIAERLGVDRTTLAAELKRNKEFAVAMSMAMAQGHMSVVEVLHKCMAGKGNSVQLRAACFMLMRKWWQDWGERKPEPEVPQEPEISQERLVAELIEEAEAQMQYEADARKQINNGEDNGDAGGT